MRRTHADLLLLCCAVIWGFAFLFQKAAMAHIGAFLFIGARGLLAAAILAPLAFLEHRRVKAPVHRQIVPLSGAAGLAFVVAAWLQQTGLKSASVTNTGFLTALYVVATPFIAFALMRRRVLPAVWGAVVLSFVGTWLLGGGTIGGLGSGDMLVAASALFWALHVVLMGMAASLRRSVLFSTLQFLVVGCVALLGALLSEPISLDGLRGAAFDILYVGVLSTALTFTAITFALRATTPTEATIIVSTETIFAALAGALVLGERLTVVSALGAAAILASVLLVQLAAARRR